MNITRRRFLQGLFAVPILSAPLLVPERLYPEVWVGSRLTGPDTATSLVDALGKVQPGGTVWLTPGYSETFTSPIVVDRPGISIVGMGAVPCSFRWLP